MRGFPRRLGANLTWALRRAAARVVLAPEPPFWLVLRLAAGVDELRPPSLGWKREGPVGLLDVLRVLAAASDDPRVAGVLIELGGARLDLARAVALRRGVLALRARGRPVVAYAERMGLGDLWVASAASQVVLPESGSLQLIGLRLEGVYLRDLLDRLSIRPEILRVGSHKTAAEALTRRGMSEPEREQLEALLDDLYDELLEAIASGRGLDRERVRELVDHGPYDARGAREVGLIDACLYRDELDEWLVERMRLAPARATGPRRVRRVQGSTYAVLHACDPGWRPLARDLPRIAYVVASGLIHRGPARFGVTLEAFRNLLERLRRDRGIRGVVLRLVSPGGDALASDLLWRELRLLRREKPLVASLGEVAASGGYYLAAAADAVVAEPVTLTGSIGVVGGKLDLSGLYRRLGVAREAVERGRRAGLESEARGFSAEERDVLRERLRELYEIFVHRVAEGRALAREAVERAAEGRIWSGRRALGLGLVDALGGPLEALAEVRRRAGLADDERVVVEMHPRWPRLGGLRARFGTDAALR